MRFLSLFAGIGGLDLGLERAGHECVGQVEIDDYCQKILCRHWPHIPKHDDVRTFQGDEFGSYDLLVAGYPCQPFSEAGKHQGERDPRHLWPEVDRIIRNVRPSYVLLENVPGHLSLGFGRVLGDLAEGGYDAEWDCIPAAAVGAPHQRYRVFIVAHAHSKRCCEAGESNKPQTPGGLRSKISNPEGARLEEWRPRQRPKRASWWDIEPSVGRVANGIPDRVDRLTALGNAVVPQVAEYIGREWL